MKQKVLFAFMLSAFVSCTNSETKKEPAGEAQVKSATKVEEPKMEYAYTIDHPDQWEWGSKENTKMVLQCLKDFENGNMDACMTAFSDSVTLRFDGMEGKFSKDSAKALFLKSRSNVKDMKIVMDDFESVKSKDGKEEWVSLWYKQKWQNKNDKWDSVSIMDDLRIMNGKIVVLDEKERHFGKKK